MSCAAALLSQAEHPKWLLERLQLSPLRSSSLASPAVPGLPGAADQSLLNGIKTFLAQTMPFAIMPSIRSNLRIKGVDYGSGRVFKICKSSLAFLLGASGLFRGIRQGSFQRSSGAGVVGGNREL